jgi:hypothetical protein
MSEDNKNSANEEKDLEKNNIDTEQEDDLSQKVETEENEQSEVEGENEVDYKSEYERLQGELAQQKERIEKQDKKIVKLKQRGATDEEEETDDVEAKIEKGVEKRFQSFVEDTIEEEIEKVSSNEDESKLIRYYFDNRIVKSSWTKKDIKDYIADAKLLANRNKYNIKSKVLAKKATSESTAGSPSFAGTPPKQSPKITDYDRRQAERFFNGDIKKWLKYKK